VDCSSVESCSETITCGSGSCDVTCGQSSCKKDVDCSNSCACAVDCGAVNSCAEGSSCPSPACDDNNGCAVSPTPCNSCSP
jgi:hypothetical protein